jgi:hypothetical protein
MKQTITKKIATAMVLLSFTAFAGQVNAQCLTAINGQYPATTFFPTCNGTVASIQADCYAGEYSVVNVTSGVQYTFSSSNATDYLTISNEAGTTAITSGVTPVIWTATVSGNVRFYTHTNAACGAQSTNRARRVQCSTAIPVPGCATNVSPANGATAVPINPATTFTWNAVPGASGYRLYLGASAAAAGLVTTSGTTSTSIYGFAVNTTYFWYVVPVNAAGAAVGCVSNATSFTTAATVSNDNCAGAIAINALSGIQAGSSYGATQSQVGCTGTATTDIWYKTTSDLAGTIIIQAVSDDDVVLQVFSGTCGSLTSLSCVDNGASGDVESYTLTAPAPNTTYYFRVYEYDGIGTGFSFSVTGTALPVTMDKLKGQVTDGNLAQLSWRTLSEQNNKGFEIQRSADGNTFNTVGFVASKAANGTSKEEITYSFTDADAINGTAYYRLQQTDIDGKTALSNTVRLTTKEKGAFELVAVPNPVKNNLNIRTYGERGNDAHILITDLSGKVVRRINVTTSEANIDMSSVSNGIYLLKYTDANRTQTIKVSKQ